MPHLIPNLEFDDSVYMIASRRFIQAFWIAWGRIPSDAQNVICGYLAAHPRRVFLCFRMDFQSPVVEPWGRLGIGDVCVFTFLAPFVERADNIEVVCSVIAHELAHCHHHADGSWTPDEDQEERRTRELTESWGFDPSPQPAPEFAADIERWRMDRAIAFGRYTETYWLAPLM
jgi:hypothetical protein